ncbi:competence protein ComEA helix-hairpin-helix repeat region [Butyrivibrio fibrisolvens 16/4]|nr:competence protein ComEA helix-hairpin-helix repeat region [Butyrivibrio fibrisolvens 16/4]
MKKVLFLVLCSLFLFTGCGHTSYFQSTQLVEESAESGEASEDATSDISEVVPQVICIQVAGAVSKPGVYNLPTGSRVYAAIEAAGGLLDSADDSDINQASLLEDGQKIYVYSLEERQQIESEKADKEDGLVNINTATEAELTSLPGIGQAKAAQIIAYRSANGDFASIEDVKNVSGIGDGIFKQIYSLIKI